MNITGKKVAKYVLLPGIVPRIQDLIGSGFGYISFFMAQIYMSVRLLPAHHPYLNPANMGRFGVIHVITEASNNISFKKENIDQIIVLFLTLIGFVILLAQFIFLAAAIFVHTANAAMPTTFAGFFETQLPEHDLALVLLERVFGVTTLNGEGFFGTCVSLNTPCFNFVAEHSIAGGTDIDLDSTAVPDGDAVPTNGFPWPFHIALHAILNFYSIGILVVAMLIFLYFMVAVTVETAQSGTPFGRRFNHVWAPIRMVVALGLLIPINQGLNSAQFITLFAAKYGSAFATNGWNIFLENSGVLGSSTDTLAGPAADLVATPKSPAINSILEFVMVYHTCRLAYSMVDNTEETDIEGWLVRRTDADPPQMTLAGAPYGSPAGGLDDGTALGFYAFGDITIRFGKYDPGAAGEINDDNELGQVRPVCGEIVMRTGNLHEPGALFIQEQYYLMVQQLFAAGGGGLEAYAREIATAYVEDGNPNPDLSRPTSLELQDEVTALEAEIQGFLTEGVEIQITQGDWGFILQQLGWGGAGLWYNKIAH